MIESKSRETFKRLIYIITISMAVIGVLFIPEVFYSSEKLSKTIEQNQGIEIANKALVSEENNAISKKVTSRNSLEIKKYLDKVENDNEIISENNMDEVAQDGKEEKIDIESELNNTDKKTTETESKKSNKKENKNDSESEETKKQAKSSKKSNKAKEKDKKSEAKKEEKSDTDKDSKKVAKKKDEEKNNKAESDSKKEEKKNSNSQKVDDSKKTAESKKDNKSSEKDTEKTTEKNDSSKKETTTNKENKKSTTKTVSISKVKISRTMDLTKRTGLSRKDFIKLMSGVRADTSGFFENNAGKIYDLCQKYSINEIFFCGLISAESGWNIASNHRRTHNYISLMRGGKLISYGSVNEGLEVAAQKLHYNYLTPGGKFYHGKTLAGVKTCFCPSSSWVGLVYGRMRQIL